MQGFVGGGSVRWNPYIYVAGNPVNYTDPSGKILPIIAAIVIGAVAGAVLGGAIDAVIQLAELARDHQCLSKFDWGRTLRAAAVGGVAGAFGGGVIGLGTGVAGLLGITATSANASTIGMLTIGLSGVVGGRAGLLTSNILEGKNATDDYWNPLSMARDAAFAIGGAWLFGKAASALTGKNINPFTSFLPKSLATPAGISKEQFNRISSVIRQQAGQYGDDIRVHGSRVTGTNLPNSDLDIAIRMPPEAFDEAVNTRFGIPNPGSAKERTMLHAIETGKTQAGEAGLRGLRKTVEAILGLDVDISLVRIGGTTDKGPWIKLP